MMFIAELKNWLSIKKWHWEAQAHKTDAEIYPAALMMGLAGETYEYILRRWVCLQKSM